MSYFVFSISVKNEKWNLETHISIFSVTLKRKSENQAEVFRNFLNFLFQFLKKTNSHLGTRIQVAFRKILKFFWNNSEQKLRPMMHLEFHCQNQTFSSHKSSFACVSQCLNSKAVTAFLKILSGFGDMFLVLKRPFSTLFLNCK